MIVCFFTQAWDVKMKRQICVRFFFKCVSADNFFGNNVELNLLWHFKEFFLSSSTFKQLLCIFPIVTSADAAENPWSSDEQKVSSNLIGAILCAVKFDWSVIVHVRWRGHVWTLYLLSRYIFELLPTFRLLHILRTILEKPWIFF